MPTVIIACDPHKASVTCAVLPSTREVVETATFGTDQRGWNELCRFIERWPDRRFAVEGAHGTGRSLAQRLVAIDEKVVDVPAKLAARVRVLSAGHGKKNDVSDAVAVGVAAMDHPRLQSVAPEDGLSELRLLVERRRDLVAERTRCVNRLHSLLSELVPGRVFRSLSADRAASALRGCTRVEGAAKIRRMLGVDLVGDLRRIDRRLQVLDAEIVKTVRRHGTSLINLFGIGEILAAKIIAHTGRVDRFANRHHFASYTGTAPIEASSGEITRHRLSRVGNRQLNHALHLMAICQIRHDTNGRKYFLGKLAEGKTRREALRCLKRRLSDAVFRAMVFDLHAVNHVT